MNNERNCGCGAKGVIRGITCDVTNCAYHESDNRCCAGHIKVGTDRAQASGETLCTTFKSRTE